ncbi:DNA-directed RNA polymerase III subunit C11 [Exophiala viscosa]|uniref:DNA-directed RNA polymerase subunit n=1 Tax=Exophiala viscosa TaxID=2486360 RepID=A0AAN6DP43_9EURO|nr:DNA-directed RNA polymerase III subunit C11 [Exophiala viscosa]KAI1628968.1 DNA-directed RNA polymerase III subunit C11 [Exophiala viscosa]
MAPTFCPYCQNSLTIARAAGTAEHPEGLNAFTCRTCPYQFVMDRSYYEKTPMKKKEKDDILGEEQSDLPVNEVPGGCPGEKDGVKCDSKKAYFYQLQTRSADEPPTSFFKCVKCAKQWREY